MQPSYDDDFTAGLRSIESVFNARVHLEPHVGAALRSLARSFSACLDRRSLDPDRPYRILLIHALGTHTAAAQSRSPKRCRDRALVRGLAREHRGSNPI